MPSATFGGTQTFWRRWGDDGASRQILMIHCSLAHSGAWQGVAASLEDMAESRAFDVPGHGKSGPWDPDRLFQEQTMAMAVDLIRDWGVGPVDLVGHSFGATVGLRLAVERPDLLRSLTLIEPPFMTPAFRAFPELEAQHDHEMAGYDLAVKAGRREEAARAFMAVWGDGRAWDRLPEVQRQGFVDRIGLIEALRATNYGDPLGMLAEGRLAALDLPVLLVESADGPVYAARINEALAQEMPWAERVVVPGAHMAPITHPVKTAKAIRSFLNAQD
ncbi:alpha/beta fold hydrolase [Pseudooceanicola algae]|uniref:(E)-2-((N-methylformamido)methylene)succinate hydrolase n=1 Tax=Pseudooceanicola algae TaxID=1537215 RepID=A0A418SH54_9RHOB|nr:alpha/beta hydrolase [Pseudooceanicola algae]QPM90385.1 (E)-2-((N-methylformamido)methylene)succinate hydrolase [Pseudooceanicola algae]